MNSVGKTVFWSATEFGGKKIRKNESQNILLYNIHKI